jgi:hypothetical protein
MKIITKKGGNSRFKLFSRYQNCAKYVEVRAEPTDFIPSFAAFYMGFQILYIYMPTILLLLFNTILLYTLYELKFKPMLNSSVQRDQKVKQVQRYSRVNF